MKTIFWNVDTQNDFMNKEGSLYVSGAGSIKGNLEKITRFAKKKLITVINTADYHHTNSAEFSNNPDFINTFPPHCVRETSGIEYVDVTNPDDPYVCAWDGNKIDENLIKSKRNIIICKDHFDVFKGNPFTDSILRAINPSKVVVYGVATNYCVDFAVKGLRKRGIEVYVLIDAIKEIPVEGEPKNTLDGWKKIGVILTTTDDLIALYSK